ncbi:hypothetical protein [Pseudomonas putida]|uniref:hypothetical protein n=1 Tax=Pseudomonas putida TaxID=303 RepID=UPI00300E878A
MATQGRKPIEIECVGGKSNRQRIWDEIRKRPDGFTGYKISRKSGVHDTAVRSYIQSLLNAGYLKIIDWPDCFSDQTLCLVKNTGIEAPTVTRKGSEHTLGLKNEAMWRSIRIMGRATARGLAESCSVNFEVSLWTARTYLRHLAKAGYVELISTGNGDRSAYYQLLPLKYTGPRAPAIKRGGVIYDANLGKVVYPADCP